MNKTQLTNQLRKRFDEYSLCLENNFTEYVSILVEIGASTIGTEESGKVIAQNALYPTQFSKAAVEEITSIKWKNENGEIINPKTFREMIGRE